MSQTQTALTALFLQSSVQDAMADYHRSLESERFPHWDAVVLTASDASQAQGYKEQLRERRDRLPKHTDFLVLPDEGNKRVGSAGSTLSALRLLREKYGCFEGKKFLVIHAGGNSSRCPQYSALGKLFAPLPMMMEEHPAALFDLFMVMMASLPGRMKEGMLLLSGDVTLLFNPLMCDFGGADAAAISFMENAETGRDHGVYVKNPCSGNVKKFLHKQSVERLLAEGAVDEGGMCPIDTGALFLSPSLLKKLYSLVDTEEKYASLVNDRVQLSLYSDVAYCLAEDSTLESYQREKPEGAFCPELTEAREKLWKAIATHSMRLISLAPAKFIHFGTIPEIMRFMGTEVLQYGHLGWQKQVYSFVPREDIAAYDSLMEGDASAGYGCYLEVSHIHGGARIGNQVYLSFMDVGDGAVIPDHLLVHGLKQRNGRFICRIMDIGDQPKEGKLFGRELQEIGERLHTAFPKSLWEAELYPECDTMREALEASLNLYRLVMTGEGDREAWQKARKKSLASGFSDADSEALLQWNRRMEELVSIKRFSEEVRLRKPAKAIRLGGGGLSPIQRQWVEEEMQRLDLSRLPDFSYAIRLQYALGMALGDEGRKSACFKMIADTVLKSTLSGLYYHEDFRIAKEEAVIRLPLRVNWGGGWTDTCPYCLENGGIVLNAAISLDGKLPVEVCLKRIPERKIIFDSRDMDVHGEFDRIEPLQQTGDPFDPFALQKACLLACGVLPQSGGNLESILKRLGGGFEMHSEVTNVPKGSGLGTSSILSAASVRAVMDFMDVSYDEGRLYATVLAMEQLMSTGGGWQDQVGGATLGIKLISSQSGINQQLSVEHVQISESTKRKLNERFAILYSGQRRLARNLLQDVVGRYVGNEPDSLYAHREIKKLALDMKDALERGDVDAFARLLNQHWDFSRMIDAGSSNTLIDHIFLSIEDMIDAKMCCGAGGGGFLQVILKKGVTKQAVHERLKDVFHDFPIDVWNSEIVYS